jgi:hypothetical protein
LNCAHECVKAEEFIRRFLLHMLPEGFQKIRYFGFMANRHHAQSLSLCRRLLGSNSPSPSTPQVKDWKERYRELTGEDLNVCPACKQGRLFRVDLLLPIPSNPLLPDVRYDTS